MARSSQRFATWFYREIPVVIPYRGSLRLGPMKLHPPWVQQMSLPARRPCEALFLVGWSNEDEHGFGWNYGAPPQKKKLYLYVYINNYIWLCVYIYTVYIYIYNIYIYTYIGFIMVLLIGTILLGHQGQTNCLPKRPEIWWIVASNHPNFGPIILRNH